MTVFSKVTWLFSNSRFKFHVIFTMRQASWSLYRVAHVPAVRVKGYCRGVLIMDNLVRSMYYTRGLWNTSLTTIEIEELFDNIYTLDIFEPQKLLSVVVSRKKCYLQ